MEPWTALAADLSSRTVNIVARPAVKYSLGALLTYIACSLACGMLFTPDPLKALAAGAPIGLVVALPFIVGNFLLQMALHYFLKKFGRLSALLELALLNAPALLVLIYILITALRPISQDTLRESFKTMVMDPAPPSVRIQGATYHLGIGGEAGGTVVFCVSSNDLE
jgi:hypothetical protein